MKKNPATDHAKTLQEPDIAIRFEDIFNLAEIQKMQDLFSDATGVASIITYPDGTPITRPSNFCRLCNDIIRKTDKGRERCFASDAALGRHHPSGPLVQACLSGGLWDAGASITVGEEHIANWLIGQVRNEQVDEQRLLQYADTIGADKEVFMEAYAEVPIMPTEQFRKVSDMLFAFANELSEKAYANLQLKIQMAEQQKATELLRKSEDALYVTLHSIGDGVISTDQNGYIVLMNPVAERFCGCTRAKAIGKPLHAIFRIMDADTRVMVSDPLKILPLKGSEGGLTNQCILLSKKGMEYHVAYSASAIRDKDGNISGMVLVFSDVTEKFISQQEIILSEEKFHSLYIHMSEGAALHELVYDAHGQPEDYIIIETNPAFEVQLGIPRGSVIGKTSREAYGVDEPPYLDIYAEVAITGTPRVFETYFPPLEKYFSISVYSPYKGSFATIFKNITESKRAEEEIKKIARHYQTIIEKAPDGIVLLDEAGLFKFMSPAARNIFGYELNEKFEGNPSDYTHPDDLYKVLSDLSATLVDPSYVPILQYRFHDKAGNWKWVESIFTNLLADPNVEAIVINFRDITERKRAEEGLRETNDYLENLINHANAPIIVWDAKLCITRFNHAFELLTGRSEAEVLGKSLKILFPPAKVKHSMALIQNTLSGERLETVELGICHRDGTIRTVLWNSATLFAADGYTPIATIAQGQDISQRKCVEEELMESEQKFRNLVQDMPVGVLLQGPGAEILLSNPKALEFLGITESQLLGKTSFDPDWNVIHEDGSPFPGPTHPVPQAIASRNSVRNVIMGVYRPASADRIWLLVDAEPQLNADGSVRQIVCSFIDISERKKVEEELREANDYLENLINHANAPIIVWDPLFRITRFNHAFESLTGRTEAEVLGQSLEILFPPELSGHSMQLIRNTLTGERWETVEIKILHLDQSVRTVLWNSATLFAADGFTPIATIAQGQDITERKQAEEALRKTNDYLENLINHSNAPIIVWDPQFRITRFNHAFESITGLSEAEVLGQSLEILFPPELAEKTMQLIRNTLTGERWETVEIEIRHSSGSIGTVLWNSATIFEPDGLTPVATIAQGQEITRRKRAEAELIVINEQLFKLNAEKDKFFSIIAHDLRSPFNAFLGFTRMMVEDLPSLRLDEIQLIALTMRNSATNLFRLLENLLDWSVLQRGLSSFNPRPALLMPLIVSSLQPVMESAAIKGVAIDFNIPDPLYVYADEQMLASILRNLISNAVKFTRKGGIVSLSAEASAGNLVKISVSDNGIGMNKKILDELFHLGEFISRKGTEGEPSTGLGLIICKDLVGKHGGQIWAQSEEGKGSTFTFTLPGKDTEMQEDTAVRN